MNEQGTLLTSSLPALAFLIPLAASAVIFLCFRAGRWLWQGVAIITSIAVAAIGLAMVQAVVGGAILTTWGNELRVDALSALMVAVIGCIGCLASIYSVPYIMQPPLLHRVGESRVERRLPVFYGLLMCFLGTMVWGSVTNNIIMLYVAVEATTLASGLLVAFYWDRRSLEAGYKYLMLLTIGITFALFGCVLVYAGAAATGQLHGEESLLLSEIAKVTKSIPGGTALVAIGLLVAGFGTKAGIAPFHPWLPDAHAEAPVPVSVMLSGVMIKMAMYALARTVSMFFPQWPQLTLFLVGLGVFTMVLGIVMAMVQDDLKRLLAYSSVSQMGYVVMGVGLGTYLGVYGGLFHLLNHAIYKALLFMCVGAVIYATGLRRISELGGLGRKMPVTSVCFFVGALAISGFPPLNGFLSKITVYLAVSEAGMWWATVIAVMSSVLTMVALIHAAYAVFWGKPRRNDLPQREVREVPAAMWFPMAVLATACLVLGLFPHAVYPLLNQAATVLATLGK